ncbi:MAG: hypothetical protein Q7R95_03075, partial [bacterium]|nr:hypothetical protein [bacterium]
KILTTTKNVKGQFLIKPSRMETLRKRFAPFHEMYKFNSRNEHFANYYMEKSLVGGAYSYQLIDVFQPHGGDLITIFQMKSSFENDRVHMALQPHKIIEGTSKNKNKYIKIFCSDHTGTGMIILCNSPKFDKINEFLEENGKKLAEDDIIVVRGKKGKDNMIWADKITIQDVKVFDKISKLKMTTKGEKDLDISEKV